MENAGRSLAELARRLLDGNVAGKRVTVLCGPGNNGGGGMAAARMLHNWGAEVSVHLSGEPSNLKEVPAQQWHILQRLGLTSLHAGLSTTDLVLDALLGYGASGEPRPPIADLIRWANDQSAPILSLDVPSGLDASSGVAPQPTVQAMATLTLALPKTGLLVQEAKKYTGELYLADIGVPPELYTSSSLQLEVGSIFSASRSSGWRI